MSFSGSLSNALSGLTAASRAAEIASSNVANALTEGYGRRVLQVSARSVGGNGAGVQIDGVQRHVDQQLITDRRLAASALSMNQVQLDFHNSIESVLGAPGTPNSLGQVVAQFEGSLVDASTRPDSTARLEAVLSSAETMTRFLRDASGFVQQERMRADADIAETVERLNTELARVAKLNSDIGAALASGRDASALMDQRQLSIDAVSDIVPIRTIERDHGKLALITTGGAQLVDGVAAAFDFSPTGTIVPEMNIGSGVLSGLTMNGQPISVSSSNGLMSGGRLSALFAIRDDLGPEAQGQLDAIARDLAERFQAPGVDPTVPAGTPGMFTDGSAAFDPINEVGISSRLTVNAVIDPDRGGDLWKIRDGLGAAVPGEVGYSGQIQAFVSALGQASTPGSANLSGAARSFGGHAADVSAGFGSKRIVTEADNAFFQARHDSLRSMELADGVDTDEEMQRLLLIEQAYAANARVIQTIDDMIQTLIRI